MLTSTKVILKAPIVLATVTSILTLFGLLALWFSVIRPNVTTSHQMELAVFDETPSTDTTENVVSMSVAVLSWSDDLRDVFERYIASCGALNMSLASVSTKYTGKHLRLVSSIPSYLDSLRALGMIDDDAISYPSLSSVLRNAFDTTHNIRTDIRFIVVVGGFPPIPSGRALETATTIIGEQDYFWLKEAFDTQLAFVGVRPIDPLRDQLQYALVDAGIPFFNFTQ
jgi:hypothetical protein